MPGAVEHKTVAVDLRSIGGSALTADIEVPESAGEGIPVTYVPARNTIMLSIALGWAEVLGARRHFLRRQCRRLFRLPRLPAGIHRRLREPGQPGHQGRRRGPWAARARAADAACRKADIVREGMRLGVDFSQTVSCYQADDEGRACGRLRCLPPARRGLRRRRRGRSDALRYLARRMRTPATPGCLFRWVVSSVGRAEDF